MPVKPAARSSRNRKEFSKTAAPLCMLFDKNHSGFSATREKRGRM